MSVSVDVYVDSGKALHAKSIKVDIIPDFCPLCHRSISPDQLSGYVSFEDLQLVLRCPDDRCNMLFLGYYKRGTVQDTVNRDIEYFYTGRSDPYKSKKRKFSSEIEKISIDFCELYNEAHKAENIGLFNICGAGYRKALEFLIKDYIYKNKIKTKTDIRTKPLSQCINDDIKDANIKACAKRAAWLGNDATHYFRKWRQLDLDDLKNLIEVTIRWIETETITRKYKKRMPRGKT